MKKEYHVYTNKLWRKQMVGYRAVRVDEALAKGADLICHTADRPDEIMTIPNFLIKRLLLNKAGRMVRDSTGASVKLYDYWWKSDADKAKELAKIKVEEEEQLKLL